MGRRGLEESRERVKEAGGPYNAALREPERFQLLCKSCNLRKRRGPKCTHNWRVDMDSPKLQKIARKLEKMKNGGKP